MNLQIPFTKNYSDHFLDIDLGWSQILNTQMNLQIPFTKNYSDHFLDIDLGWSLEIF
jgi:hypothetical protein